MGGTFWFLASLLATGRQGNGQDPTNQKGDERIAHSFPMDRSGTVCISEACPAQIAANLGKRLDNRLATHCIPPHYRTHFPADLAEKQ
jgi:hypothetical protein